MVFRAEKWSSSGGSIDRIEGGLYSEFGHCNPNFGRRRLFLQSSRCRILVKGLIPGEAGYDDEKDEEEEKNEVISVKRRIRKGKEKVEEALQAENSGDSSDHYEQVASDGDYRPNGDNAAQGDEVPEEGTSQSAQRRSKKRKRVLDNVDGELETSRRCGKSSFYRNHVNFQVHDLDESNDNANAKETKSPIKKQRRARKEKEAYRLHDESEDAQWARSLRGPHLRLMQALKDLGTERVNTIKEESLYNCLTPAALRVIGIILEEHVKEQLSLLGCETAGDVEEEVQKGDFSSAEEEGTAGNGRSVDAADHMETDMKGFRKSSKS
ncbi:hypothetical protein R1flu_008942 [Riccia fluitans]|uniref:Uncharacterized protein n=1 Tax=Riccia fluitans TaxID=41844 RepID=A0ABD1Z0N3_9MARC